PSKTFSITFSTKKKKKKRRIFLHQLALYFVLALGQCGGKKLWASVIDSFIRGDMYLRFADLIFGSGLGCIQRNQIMIKKTC
ncbi:hypothetical protein PJM48_29225, partial [Mycobacterium kansasii]